MSGFDDYYGNAAEKKAWLDFLYYSVGKQNTNFRLCYTKLNEYGEVQFSKWIPYLDAQQMPWFIKRVNQREILLNEVVFDLDDKSKSYDELIAFLTKNGIMFFAYEAGEGRARHVHTYWEGLTSLPKFVREQKRENILRNFGCDPALKSDSHLIPIEYCPHWKTGVMKNKKVVMVNG